MKDNNQFENQVRHKIAGWYSDKQYEDKAVARICNVRNQIIGLLQSTGRDGVDDVIEYLDNSGFYYRASSSHGHHNFPGGLAEHCLGTYLIAKDDPKAKDLPKDQVIIGALLHDICKADRFWFKGRSINKHHPKCEMDGRHSVRSIAILKDCGLKLNNDERLAIRWHMKGRNYNPKDLNKKQDHDKAVKEPLWDVVFRADKQDAGVHPARNHPKSCSTESEAQPKKSYLEILVPLKTETKGWNVFVKQLETKFKGISVNWYHKKPGYNYHITMVFIDDNPQGADLTTIFERHLKSLPAFNIIFDKVDVFTSDSNEQIINLTATQIPDQFLTTIQLIRKELKLAGCLILKEFKLHVTLGKIKPEYIHLKPMVTNIISVMEQPIFNVVLRDVDYGPSKSKYKSYRIELKE